MRAWLGLLGLVLVACPAPPTPPRTAPDARVGSPRPPPPAQTSSVAVSYRVQVPAPASHYVQVQARFLARGRDQLVVMLPVWTPGSYLIREYSRHLDQLTAEDASGRPLKLSKVRKNRWQVELDGAKQAILRYRVYANEPSVRTNLVDEDFLVLNGAATFLADVDAMHVPHEVQLDLQPTYADVAADLGTAPSGARVARDYDHLVDAPIVGGQLRRLPFEVRGVPHELVQLGGAQTWPDARAQAQARRVVEAVIDFWGEVPYERYLFLNVINESRGGLEHKGSTLMMVGRLRASTEAGLRSWLGLVAHESFHAWNGKRLRPEALGPFDYENEVYTEGLWFVEGLTSYYDDLLLRRAEVTTEAQYLEALSGQIKGLEAGPGQRVQPLAQASYDAWIEFYRPDESSPNTTVSYYTKGAVVGFVLDMALRRATGGSKSLDDVMRLAYRRHSGVRGYSEAELLKVFEDVGGAELRPLLQDLLHGTQPVPYVDALAWAGLRFKAEPEPSTDKTEAEQAEQARKKTWLGAKTEKRDGRCTITGVVAGGPAEQAGLQVDDELVAIEDLRLTGELAPWLALYGPGETVKLLIARRGAMRTVSLTFGRQPSQAFDLELDPKAGSIAASRRAAWLQP